MFNNEQSAPKSNVKDHFNKIKSWKNYIVWSIYKTKFDSISLNLMVENEPYLPNISVNSTNLDRHQDFKNNGHQVYNSSCPCVWR